MVYADPEVKYVEASTLEELEKKVTSVILQKGGEAKGPPAKTDDGWVQTVHTFTYSTY